MIRRLYRCIVDAVMDLEGSSCADLHEEERFYALANALALASGRVEEEVRHVVA